MWGSSFLWIKIALRGFPPAQITVVRLAIGAAVLVVWLRSGGGRLPRGFRLWAHLAVAACVANVLPYLLFAFGEQQVDSSVAGILNATTPIWTALLAVLAGQERVPTRTKAAGLGLGIAGTLLIFTPWQHGSQFWTAGAAACLAAAISYAISYVYMARYLAPRRLSALELSASQLLAATAISAVLTPLLGGWQTPEFDGYAVAALLVLSLSTGVAYVLNYRVIQDDGATAASVVVYLLPAVAILLGLVVLAEDPSLHAVAGVAVVLSGVALARQQQVASRRAE